MPQLTLFAPAARLARDARVSYVQAGRDAPEPAARLQSSLRAGDGSAVPRADASARRTPLERTDEVQIDHESDRILDALRCETHDGFLMALEPLLTAEERTLLRTARGLPIQMALIYDHILERLTLRWAELNQWQSFARTVEPGVLVRPSLRACVLELAAPSRNLAGRVAFRVERDLARVASPIPAPVLRCIGETWRATFAALAYLEPLYSTRREAGSRRLLRSIAEVRQHYAEPIDPLVIGWLGGGPRNYGFPGLVERPAWPASERPLTRHSSLGELVFLLGHWD